MHLLTLLLAASSAVSAAILPREAVNLPSSAFPGFETISLEEAKAGKDLKGLEFNATHAAQDGKVTVQTAAAADCASNPDMHIEWRSYSRSDRLAFIGAIKCLMNKPPSGNFSPAKNRYEDLVRLHQKYMPNIHQNPKFLIWHRYFVWTFHQVLRNECGFDRPFPWWDETKDAGRFGQSDLFTSPDYFGRLPGPQNGQPVCIISGAFAGHTVNIGPGSSNTPHCLSRAGDAGATSQCNQGFVNTCNARSSYAEMESCSEYGPHAYGHNGIGGVMKDVSSSPGDPIFWMHHSFVDHSFRIWQNADPIRKSTINGADHFGNPLTLDTVLDVGGIMPNARIRDVLDTMSGATIGGKRYCYRYDY